jgi:hypothetical protein
VIFYQTILYDLTSQMNLIIIFIVTVMNSDLVTPFNCYVAQCRTTNDSVIMNDELRSGMVCLKALNCYFSDRTKGHASVNIANLWA